MNDLLRNKSIALHNAIKSNLLPIAICLYREGLIAKPLYEKVVEGVPGMDSSQLSAQVSLAVGNTLATYPEQCLKYVKVLEKFDSNLAWEMEQKFKGELTHLQHELFSAMRYSHKLRVNGVCANPNNTFRASPLMLTKLCCASEGKCFQVETS